MAKAIVENDLAGVSVEKIREMLDKATDTATIVKAVDLAIKAVATVKENDKQELEIKTTQDFFAEIADKVKAYEGKHEE